MKKRKLFCILLIVLLINFIFTCVSYAHSIDLDPNSLIGFPISIFNGKGSFTIKSSESNYTLYYQAVELQDSVFNKLEQLNKESTTKRETFKEELDALKTELNNLETIVKEKEQIYKDLITNQTTGTELEEAKTAYETAETNYNNKVEEHNTKLKQSNEVIEKINNEIKALMPSYVEGNWKVTQDNNFEVDISQFTGKKAYSIWAKLVSADGTISYDTAIYTFNGTKSEDVKVEAISLDRTEISLEQGSTYSFTATITPVDATNKSIIWTSDNESVATVENGKITAMKEGTTIITATTEDGNFTATCKVTITQKTVPTNTQKPDSTTSNGVLPQTGDSFYFVLFGGISLVVFAVIMAKKFKFLDF